MTEEPASVAGPQGLEDAAVDQTDARTRAPIRDPVYPAKDYG
jgi:hypothetical protein